jgi:hypothetical protein
VKVSFLKNLFFIISILIEGNLENEWVVWNKLVNHWSMYMKKKSIWIKVNLIMIKLIKQFFCFFKDLIRSGVPVHFRPLLWQCLTNVETSDAKIQYVELMKITSPCEKVIRRDISRTYPEHEFFKEKNGLGQESLFNVIKVQLIFKGNIINLFF